MAGLLGSNDGQVDNTRGEAQASAVGASSTFASTDIGASAGPASTTGVITAPSSAADASSGSLVPAMSSPQAVMRAVARSVS